MKATFRRKMKTSPYVFIVMGVLALCIIYLYTMRMEETEDLNKQADSNGEIHSPNSSDNVVDISGEPNKPCVYADEVDLRIIIMTFNRAESLKKLLISLDDLQTDGSRVAIEIWIDRDKKGKLHEDTLKVAKTHKCPNGPVRVHIQQEHVGIYGQWIDTWRPKDGSSELGLLLEDDLTVSPFAWRLESTFSHFL